MKEIDSFASELSRTRAFGQQVIAADSKLSELNAPVNSASYPQRVVAVDSKLSSLIESELSALDDSYWSLQNGAQAMHVRMLLS